MRGKSMSISKGKGTIDARFAGKQIARETGGHVPCCCIPGMIWCQDN